MERVEQTPKRRTGSQFRLNELLSGVWRKITNNPLTKVKNRYRIAYLETHGCMTVVEEDYICYAFTKYDAWLSFVKNVGVSGHYTCRENLSSFTKTLEDIHRIPHIETVVGDDGVKFERIQEKNIFGIDANCCPFCNCETSSGSWSPDGCVECGAVNFFGSWTRDIQST